MEGDEPQAHATGGKGQLQQLWVRVTAGRVPPKALLQVRMLLAHPDDAAVQPLLHNHAGHALPVVVWMRAQGQQGNEPAHVGGLRLHAGRRTLHKPAKT